MVSASLHSAGLLFLSIYQIMQYYLNGQSRACFTPTLLIEIQHLYTQICSELTLPEGREIRFLIASLMGTG